MIPATNTITSTDQIPAEEEIEFGIGDPRWVMRTQAELYSDVTTAIIREYSTNAYDAHVMAGHSDPIEVTLPTMMNPFFIVEDHGVGMDIEIFRANYTQFGVSDKRYSNEVNGMLGYGSKSGVAYATEFSVTSIKDGCKIEGTIKRKPDWSIVLKVMRTTATTERNGTKIVIPVHNIDEFRHKAEAFYKFWLPGRVLVDGVEPVHAVGDKIAEGLYYAKDYDSNYYWRHNGESQIVMGNVPYRINNPEALFEGTGMKSIPFVAYVDNGDVEFTPSREDLKYSVQTKKTLHKVFGDFQKEIMATAQAEIDGAVDHAEAFMKWTEWCSRLGSGMFDTLTFKGTTLESDFPLKGRQYTVNSYRYNVSVINKYSVQSAAKTLFITDFHVEVSANTKAKARGWIDWKNLGFKNVVFTPQSKVDSVWVPKANVVSWSHIKDNLPKNAIPRANGGRRRIPGTFDYITKTGKHTEKPLPDDVDLYYVTVYQSKTYTNISGILRLLDTDAAVVILAENRVTKFTRENKTENFLRWAKTQVESNPTVLLDKDGIELLSYDSGAVAMARVLPVNDLDDKRWKRIKELDDQREALLKAYKVNLERAAAVYAPVPRYEPKTYVNPLADYPLLRNVPAHTLRVEHDDVVLYMNAAYAARKDV